MPNRLIRPITRPADMCDRRMIMPIPIPMPDNLARFMPLYHPQPAAPVTNPPKAEQNNGLASNRTVPAEPSDTIHIRFPEEPIDCAETDDETLGLLVRAATRPVRLTHPPRGQVPEQKDGLTQSKFAVSMDIGAPAGLKSTVLSLNRAAPAVDESAIIEAMRARIIPLLDEMTTKFDSPAVPIQSDQK